MNMWPWLDKITCLVSGSGRDRVREMAVVFLVVLLMGGFLFLSGCATGTALMEAYVTPPSVSDTLDSFETAALAIRASNRILRAPICENSEWPIKLWQAPKGENTAKMAIAMFGASKGITVPTEFDPETGFPRPTSALYLLIKDRMAILDETGDNRHSNYFTGNPDRDYFNPSGNTEAVAGNPFIYRSTLCAYGTVMNNSQAVKQAEMRISNYYNGYEECDAWIKHSEEGQVVDAACKASINSGEVRQYLEERAEQNKEDLERDKKQYAKLAERVHKASLGGADFTAAAVTKIVCAVIKAPRALQNMHNELQGWRGAVNIAMLGPRIKNAFKAVGIYRENLGLQATTYNTMISGLKGKYDLKEDRETKAAWMRIKAVEEALKDINPKLALWEKGEEVDFTRPEISKWELLASSFPENYFQDGDTSQSLIATLSGRE